MFSLRLLGGILLEGPDGQLSGRSVQRRPIAVLALLASAGHKGMSRDKLVGYLWPETEDDRARRNLSDALYTLRQSLGESAILTAGDVLRLNFNVISVDSHTLETALEQEDYEAASRVFSGPLLDGFYLTRAPDFEHWVDSERLRLADLYANALERLAERAESSQDHQSATEWWKRLAAHDPYNTRVVVRLMQALAESGDPANALEYARLHEERIREDLGIEVRGDLVELAQSLRSGRQVRPVVAARNTRSEPGTSATESPHKRQLDSLPADAPTRPEKSPQTDLRAVWRALALYIGASWIVYAVVRTLAEVLDLPDWLPTLSILVLIIGMPVVLIAAFLRAKIDQLSPSTRTITVVFAFALGLSSTYALRSSWLTDGLNATADSAGTLIAVLPFRSTSDVDELLSEALAADIIVQLTKVSNLAVRPHAAVLRYRQRQAHDLTDIAAYLQVETVLDGYIQRTQDGYRITAELIDTRTETNIWAETFNASPLIMANLHNDLSLQIVDALGLNIEPELRSRIARVATRDTVARRLFVLGRHHLDRITSQDNRKAIEYLTKALEQDPDYAEAYLMLALAYAQSSIGFGLEPPRELLAKAQAAAEKALKAKIDEARAQLLMARIKMLLYFDWAGADDHLERALQLDSGDAAFQRGAAWQLIRRGRFEEAVARMQEALRLDPTSRVFISDQAAPYFFAGQYARAEEKSLAAIDFDPNFPIAHWSLGRTYVQMEKYIEAIEHFDKALSLGRLPPFVIARRGYASAQLGRVDEAVEALSQLQNMARERYVSPVHTATVYMGLDDRERIFRLLNEAVDDRAHEVTLFSVSPLWLPLHSDPRFKNLLKRINRG